MQVENALVETNQHQYPMKIITARVPHELYTAVRQYKLERSMGGQKLTISEALSELLRKGLLAVQAPPNDLG
jgi:hypothetical protein